MAKVLLADDEEALRIMMGRQLKRAGHNVTTAEDGQVAADLLANEDFDVVISDMKMPRLDGMGLLQKAIELRPTTEFIFITGHGSLENAVVAFKQGNVFDYLLKPLNDIHELDGVVARAAERRTLRSENGRLVSELEQRVTELEAAKVRLSHLAERDGLTGLYNHRTIHASLETAMNENPDETFALMLLDMDGFKRLNDAYGHPVGDQVLRYLSEKVRSLCPTNALIGRCGGDEFMVILPGKCATDAGHLAESIRAELAGNPFVNPEGTPLPIHLCFGIADSTAVGGSPHCLVAAADAALFAGKGQGGDAVVLHMVQEETAAAGASRTAFDVLDSLVTAIDVKDRYTRLHSEHMTGFALQLVDAIGCSEEIHNVIRCAGLLHDVGKIGVPDSILRKPGKLTDEEYEIMKNHVVVSGLIVHGMPNIGDILDAVSNHHERWDGFGYPRGLKGEQIPLLGRIMALADAYSAMTLDRPYRSGMNQESALAELEKCSGTQFDPELAKVFVKNLKEGLAAQRKAA